MTPAALEAVTALRAFGPLSRAAAARLLQSWARRSLLTDEDVTAVLDAVSR